MAGLQKYFVLFQYRDYLKLWGAQVSSKLAENFFNFSLVILIYELTESSAFVSILIVLISIPPIVLSAFAGVVADSYNRKTVLLLSNLGRLLISLVAILFISNAYVLLGIAFAIAVVAQFFSPAEVASIPTLVPKEHLFTANSLYSVTNYAMFLLGYTLAGPLLANANPIWTFVMIMILYLSAVGLNMLLPPLQEHLKKNSEKLREAFSWRVMWQRLISGIKFIFAHRIIRFIILQLAIVFSIQRGFLSLVPAFAQDFLKINVEDISLLLILPLGIGAMAGVITANRIKHRTSKSIMITAGLLLDGLTLFGLAFWPDIQSAMINGGFHISPDTFLRGFIATLAFVSGFADPLILVSAQTALHERTPAEERGRVFGGLYTIINSLGLVPILVIGFLTSYVNFSAIIAGLGLIILITAARGIVFYQRYSLGTE